MDCASCHTDGYAGTPQDCFSCHESDFSSASDPSHDGFPTTCEDCHTVSGWSPASFDHNATSFPLQGAHRSVDCASCHTDGYAGTPQDCFSCHESDFNSASDPSHDGFPTACEDCHTVSGWSPASFDHNVTSFPLQGAHRSVDCASCHANGYAGTPQDCFSCHDADYNGATSPDHDGFPTTCEDCHTVSGWSPASFDHNATSFPLQGAHRAVDCQSCHAGGYAGTPQDCFSCHDADYNGATNPDHDGFPTTCEDCHTVSGWSPANFDHNVTAFPLQGAHRAVDCQSCHAGGYAGTPQDCFSCHDADYNGATNPDHDGFPTTCEDCHTVSGWSPANFDHNVTAFPLQGAHRTVDCQSCHAGGYAGTPTDCFSCHDADYNGATNPDHDGFPTTCEDCHTVSGWSPANFDHNVTAFPLQGAHRTVDCQSCHAGGYAGTPTDCFSCHDADYNGATNPDHDGFPTTCEDCHTVSGWSPANFDHNVTAFPLQGAHRTVDCQSCHAGGYAGTPTDCFSCHDADYNGATNPDHDGFPTTCEDCHTVSGWSPANFDHNVTAFPLQGAHRAVDCLSCHAGGYAGTPTDCFSCHDADYNGATNPDHDGFPTTCEDCHSVSGWSPASFDHNQTAFPLRGAHQAVDCLSCHAGGYAGTPQDCFSCHDADYNGANNPDHTGFPTTCEDCHSESGWSPANFDHNQTAFPLDGAHLSLDCLSCHAGGYGGTPTDCYACHANDYATANPDHVAAGFPTTCETCHTTADWDDVTWDHDDFFPIYSGSHRGEWSVCEDCHVAPGNPTIFECIFCHAHTQPDMDDEHDDVSGYIYESNACLSCHPDGEE